MRKRRLTLCASISLTIVLGLGPLLTIAAPVDKIVRDSSKLLARASGANGGASTPAKPPFSSKLLSKWQAQNVAAIPGQTTTLLQGGHVLKTGGIEDDGPVSAAVIDGSLFRLQRARAWHTATMLPDGKILIIGGIGINGQPVDPAEIFNPDSNLGASRVGSSITKPQSAILDHPSRLSHRDAAYRRTGADCGRVIEPG